MIGIAQIAPGLGLAMRLDSCALACTSHLLVFEANRNSGCERRKPTPPSSPWRDL